MMIATILDRQTRTVKERIAMWRQLSDILAQRGAQLHRMDAHRALRALASFRSDVPEYIRRDSALSVAQHGRFAPLIALYANDVAPVAMAMLQHCRLTEEDWLLLLPSIGITGRFVLAGRDDLPGTVRRALASLGAEAIALPPPLSEDRQARSSQLAATIAASPIPFSATSQPKRTSSQISELVRRIDRFQVSRSSSVKPPAKRKKDGQLHTEEGGDKILPPPAPTQFRFETSADGVIDWTDGILPQMIIGLSLAEPAIGNGPGCDARAAHAFRQQAEIVGASIHLIGPQVMAGQWEIFAEPVFVPMTGQFQGYRGVARRPVGRPDSLETTDSRETSDGVRQLTHELRSPLNAISGFAQIISGQIFGPVEPGYREMADHIVADALKVQTIIDDLDAASRKTEGHVSIAQPHHKPTDMADICAHVHKDVQPLLTDHPVTLSISADGGPFWVRIEAEKVRRMIGRLITSLIEVSEPNALLVARLSVDLTRDDRIELRIVRPTAIRFLSAEQLLHPDADDGVGHGAGSIRGSADIYGLSFALRLVSSLAAAEHGRLDISANALILHLPLATADG